MEYVRTSLKVNNNLDYYNEDTFPLKAQCTNSCGKWNSANLSVSTFCQYILTSVDSKPLIHKVSARKRTRKSNIVFYL